MNRILTLETWETPATSYEVSQSGNFRLGKVKRGKGRYPHAAIDGYLYTDIPDEITLVVLQEFRDGEWHDWMCDDPFDYHSMQKYAQAASGNVLTCGLGLGLLTHELCKNDKVESITIVELNPDVVKLVEKYLPKNKPITIESGDFWEFTSRDTNKWGLIVVDIWVARNKEERLTLFRNEVMDRFLYMRGKYPETKLVFHGFSDISDIKATKSYLETREEERYADLHI